MSSVENWIEEQEALILFENAGGGGAEASRLLEISPTNRNVVDSNQAKLLMVLRLTATRFRSWYPDDKTQYAYIDKICDLIEQHQLTLAGESRFEFSRVAIAQYIARLITRGKRELESLVRNVNQ